MKTELFETMTSHQSCDFPAGVFLKHKCKIAAGNYSNNKVATLSCYSGFRRKARVIKCKPFGHHKGSHDPRRSVRKEWKVETRMRQIALYRVIARDRSS